MKTKQFIINSTRTLLLAGIIALSGCSRNPVTGRRQLLFSSKEQEMNLGKQTHPSVVATMGIYENKKLESFINSGGKKLVAAMPKSEQSTDYKFFIVDSPVVNAFAVPGGYVYFTRGIMSHFNNEAEFAGVLGHEIGHVVGRHSAEQQMQQTLGQLGLIGGMIFVPQLRSAGENLMQGMQLVFLKFSRNHEMESDKIGTEYASKLGYDAKEMANFFNTLKRLSDQSGQAIPTLLSTHPDPGDRFARVNQMAKEYQQKNPGKYNINRDTYLKMIDGIIYGEDPKQGFVENHVFYQPVMKFQLPVPNDWQYENTPMQFQMAPKDGKALVALTLAEGKSLEAAAQNFVKQTGAKVTESTQTTINGNPAVVMVWDQQPQDAQGQPATQQDPASAVRAVTWIINYDKAMYAINGLSLASDFNARFPQFKSVAGGFKALTDPSKLNRKPERIQVRPAGRSATFADIMRDFKMPDKRIEELAIVNGMQSKDQVTKGSLIKIIGQ